MAGKESGWTERGRCAKIEAVKVHWRLKDVVDFELLLEKTSLWKESWRGGVKDEVEQLRVGSSGITEVNCRRWGLRQMLEQVRGREHEQTGTRVVLSLRLVGLGFCLLMFLLGVALVRGQLVNYQYLDDQLGEVTEVTARGFNIWILLASTIGIQLLLLLISGSGYWLWRRWRGNISMLQGLLALAVRRFGAKHIERSRWSGILQSGMGMWHWRLARLLQAAGVTYNVGLLVGLLGCLWFMQVWFFLGNLVASIWERESRVGNQDLVSVSK